MFLKTEEHFGTFEFVAYLDDQKDSVVVRNGVFKDIPNLLGN
jgi:hypothetical protein